jgi:hypothetical protein
VVYVVGRYGMVGTVVRTVGKVPVWFVDGAPFEARKRRAAESIRTAQEGFCLVEPSYIRTGSTVDMDQQEDKTSQINNYSPDVKTIP